MVPLIRSKSRRSWGRQGEQWAERELRRQGYKILARNYRTPVGEIDLVASQDGVLVFIEVKLRRQLHYGAPQEAVTRSKQRHLCQAALYYLRQQHLELARFRFDVVAITLAGTEPQIEIIPHAFGE